MRSTTVASAAARGSRPSTSAETTDPSTAQNQRTHQFDLCGAAGALDGLGHGLSALTQAAAHAFAQVRQAGTGDMALVS